MHKGLEAHYKGKSDAVAHRAMQMLTNKLNIMDNPYKKILLTDAYDAYQRAVDWVRESEIDKNLEVIDVEKRLFLDMGEILGDHIILTGEPDLVQRDKFGLVHIRDWKGVASYSSLAGFIGGNRQGLTYSLMWQQLTGETPTTFSLHQVMRKKPAKPRNPFIPNDMVTQWLTPESIEQHRVYLMRLLTDMVQLHQEVEAGDESGAYPNPKWTCANMCGMFQVCCGGIAKGSADLAEEIRVNYRRKEDEQL